MNKENNIQQNKINYKFKFLYAVGIFFIVAGHYRNASINVLFDWFLPKGSNIPLFMFCSGYFYKSSSINNIYEYFVKKIQKLLIPLYTWNLFYGILAVSLHIFGVTIGQELNFYNLFLAPLKNGHQFSYNDASWFICPLLMVEFFNVLFRKLLTFLKVKNEYLILLIYFIIGFIGVSQAMRGYNSGWWLPIIRFCVLLPFYGIGHFYRIKLESMENKISDSKYFIILFSVVLLSIVFMPYRRSYIYAWCKEFDNIFNPFVIGCLGIAFWLRIAKVLEPIIKCSKSILLVADNTWSIMMHHLLGLFVVKSIFAVGKISGIAFLDFNVKSFSSNIFYYYVPWDIKQFSLFFVIISIGSL